MKLNCLFLSIFITMPAAVMSMTEKELAEVAYCNSVYASYKEFYDRVCALNSEASDLADEANVSMSARLFDCKQPFEGLETAQKQDIKERAEQLSKINEEMASEFSESYDLYVRFAVPRFMDTVDTIDRTRRELNEILQHFTGKDYCQS